MVNFLIKQLIIDLNKFINFVEKNDCFNKEFPFNLLYLWCEKNLNDEWWSSFVTSPLAVICNWFVVDIAWITPNLITLLSFMVALASAVFICLGSSEESFGTAFYVAAAVLIHVSHILDCMDGQMARYRGTLSRSGGFYDKATDHLQVFVWFGAIAYAGYAQTKDVTLIFLAFIGVCFYALRGYVKYVAIHSEMERDKEYLTARSRTSAAKARSTPTTL